MACFENICTTSKCSFQQFSNVKVKVCPLCGREVLNYFDEPIEEDIYET